MTFSILLVEDDTAIAQSIVYALNREQFTTHWISVGCDALPLLKQKSTDLIILDVGLPDKNGFDLCKEIRSQYATLPIIFLTAQADEIDRVVGFELGADDYMAKPFSVRELLLRIKAILRRSPENSTTAVAHPAFTHEAHKAQIYYCGKPLTLTRSEYILLELLIDHPEHVFSREVLLEKLGHASENSTDRAIDTHIKELRAKLRTISNTDPIVTHRGLGYSLMSL